MSATARMSSTKLVLALVVLVAAPALIFVETVGAAAGTPQICAPETSCTIGEFLYDDEYTPITSGICTITSRDPGGTVHLNSQSMTAAADGWYYHTFTTPATTGLYRAQLCCTSGSDYLCLDKSFEVKSNVASLDTADIASAVWSYSGRTMTSFSGVASDVWGYSSRALSSFGTLAQDVWNHNPRTLTSSDSTDLSSVKKTVEANRLLLEKLVNKPIIQNFVESDEPDLTSQLDKTKIMAEQLDIHTQTVVSQLGTMLLKWEKLSGDEIAETLKAVKTASEQGLEESKWFKEVWKWQLAEEIYDQNQAVLSFVADSERLLSGENSKTPIYTSLKKSLMAAEVLESMVTKNLTEKVNVISELADRWKSQKSEIEKLLSEGKKKDFVSLTSSVEEIGKQVVAFNRIPKGAVALETVKKMDSEEKRLKNRLLSMRGLVDSNMKYIAKGGVGTYLNTWLEEGSIIFKSLVTNPSTLISQTVQVKYYLPPEVTKESILETDDGVKVEYDVEKNQYFVEGEFLLKAGESRTISVRTNDVWELSETDVASLRKQAEELSKPLEKTAFFAQGVTLASDINVSLDKASSLYNSAETPEQKIRSYRESRIELDAAKLKVDKLKELVSQVSSSRSLLGFVGGAQVFAVWGLVIILLAGFVFLALYMKTISATTKKKVAEETKVHHVTKHGGSNLRWVGVILITGITSAMISAVVVRQSVKEAKPMEQPVTQVKGVETEAKGGPEWVRIEVPGMSAVNLRSLPEAEAKVEFRFVESADAIVMDRQERWVQILLDGGKYGWVAEEFVVEVMNEN